MDDKLRPELKMALFWDKSSEFPPMAWEQWRERFHTALLAKYDIDTEKLEDFIPRPILNFVAQDAPPGQIETRNAQNARLERNKENKARAEDELKTELKNWNEIKVA